jgi:hypothetical protein
MHAEVQHVRATGEDSDEDSRSSDSCQQSRREGSPFLELVPTTDDDSDLVSESSARSRQNGTKTRVMNVEPAGPGSVPTLSFSAATSPAIKSSAEPARQASTTPLPNYSPHLPPIDRTKTGEDFFADLHVKRIIPEYDQERFSCWCYVAKRAQNPGKHKLLSNSHCVTHTTRDSTYRFQMHKWFVHVAKCAFYKVSRIC